MRNEVPHADNIQHKHCSNTSIRHHRRTGDYRTSSGQLHQPASDQPPRDKKDASQGRERPMISQKPLDRLITIKEVISQVGMGRTKIYEMLQFEEFPAPIKLGRYSRWSQLEIQAWIEEQKEKRAA